MEANQLLSTGFSQPSCEDPYSRLLQTEEGREEAWQRRVLWEIRKISLEQFPRDEDQLCEVLRNCYTLHRREWERRKTGVISQYYPSERWNSIWPKAAHFCAKEGISPEVLVKALFRLAKDERFIHPNSLLSQQVQAEAARAYSSKSAVRKEDLDLIRSRCVSAFEELKRKLNWLRMFSDLRLGDSDLLHFAAVSQKGTTYVLPVYCVSATQEAWNACKSLREEAFEQWQQAPREYMEVLGDLCPPEWRAT